jgi:hypothetical protein
MAQRTERWIASLLLSLPPRSGGEGSRVGGCAANAAVSEFADRPPTPDPSERASLVSTPPRADARGGRGEGEFNFQTAFRTLAARNARVMRTISRPLFRGRRECRAPDAPAAACAMVERKKAHALVRSHRKHPALPAQWFYGLLRALPGDRAFLPPSSAKVAFHKLDASVEASGPHDFAVRLSAIRQRRIHVHRIPPRVRDDREPPLCGTRRHEL